VKIDRRHRAGLNHQRLAGNRSRNVEGNIEVNARRSCNAPRHVNLVVVSRMRFNLGKGIVMNGAPMNVRESGAMIVIEIFGVNVEEWRLNKPPQ